MSSSKNIKCFGEKDATESELCMQTNKLDGCPSNLFLTLLICLQCSDNDFGGDVSSNVLYELGLKVDLISVVFSRCLLNIPSTIKIVLEAINV